MAQIERNGRRLAVSGAMTMQNVNALLAEGRSLFSDGPLEMDLAGVSDVDSAAVSLLFEWLRQARERNVGLMFVNLPANLSSLATLYGVLDLITHQPAH